MSQFPEIFVLRHGETIWNREGRHQGRMNSDLTALGHSQARDQADLLKAALTGRSDVVARTSPQGRAMQTARVALAKVALDPLVDDRLCEISFGQWEGLTFDDIAARWPERVSDLDHAPLAWNFQSPGGENFDVMRARVLDVLQSLTGPTVLITHGITSRFLRALWLGGEWDLMKDLPGGQGCVYHLVDGQHHALRVD